MRSNQIYISLILSLLLNLPALAQVNLPEFPSAREVVPRVIAEVDTILRGFTYQYQVSNEDTALQDIWIFMVEIKTVNFSATTPFDWDSSNIMRSNISVVTWGANDFPVMITPDSALTGFGVSSMGLPSVNQFFASGYIDLPQGEFDFKKGTNDIFLTV